MIPPKITFGKHIFYFPDANGQISKKNTLKIILYEDLYLLRSIKFCILRHNTIGLRPMRKLSNLTRPVFHSRNMQYFFRFSKTLLVVLHITRFCVANFGRTFNNLALHLFFFSLLLKVFITLNIY